MEQEYKWTATRADFEAICAKYASCCGQPELLRLDATYYDTTDRTLRAQKIGMRLRQENGTSVFCVKTGGTVQQGLHAHAEYEYPAQTLEEGLAQLPAALEELKAGRYVPICASHIDRTAVLLTTAEFTAELTLDTGELAGGENRAPVSEIEFELKSGDPTAFIAFGADLAASFSLVPQPLSKLARALALANPE